MSKRRPLIEKKHRRVVSAALREQGLLFRCGHGAVQELLFKATEGGHQLSVLTATGASIYNVPTALDPSEISDRPLRASYECPCFCAAQQGPMLALAHREVRLFQEDEQGAIQQMGLSGHQGQIFQVSIGGEGPFVATLAEDEQLRLFQPGSAEAPPLREIAVGSPALCFAPQWGSLQAALGFADGRVEQWDLGSGLKIRELGRYPQGIAKLVYDREQLLVLDQDGKLWKDSQPWASEIPAITAIHLSPQHLYLGTELGEIHCLAREGEVVGRWEAHGEAVAHLVGPDDESWLASASLREPCLWFPPWPLNAPLGEEGESAEPISCELQEWHEEVLSQAVSPQGRWLACGGGEGQVVLRSLDDGRVLETLAGHSDCVTSLAFSGDESALASGSADGLVLVWDPRSAELLATLDGHDESITALIYGPKGDLLVSGASDGLIILWHPETEQAITQFSGFDSGGVVNLALARRGEILLAHYESGHSLAWDLTRWINS